MPFGDTIILEFNQNQKNYYLEFITEKIDGWKNNPENSSRTKLREHVQSAFQCLQYLNLEAEGRSIMYKEVKIVWKSFVNT